MEIIVDLPGEMIADRFMIDCYSRFSVHDEIEEIRLGIIAIEHEANGSIDEKIGMG